VEARAAGRAAARGARAAGFPELLFDAVFLLIRSSLGGLSRFEDRSLPIAPLAIRAFAEAEHTRCVRR
jgi:hypothetical protein